MKPKSFVLKSLRLILPMTLLAAPFARASEDPVTRIDAFETTENGLVMKLDRTLSTGETEMSAKRIGEVLAGLIRGGMMLTPSDVDTFATTLLRNFEVTNFAQDPRLAETFRAVYDIMKELPIDRPYASAMLNWDVRNAYVALRLIQAHRGVGSAETNLLLQNLLAKWLSQRIVFYQSNEGFLPAAPDDDQLQKYLLDLAHAPGLDEATRAFWPLLVDRLEIDLPATGTGTTARMLRNLRIRWTFMGGATSGLLGAGALVWLQSQGLEPASVAVGAASAFAGSLAGMALSGGLFRALIKSRLVEGEQRRVHAFLDRCERQLTGINRPRENSNPAAAPGAA